MKCKYVRIQEREDSTQFPPVPDFETFKRNLESHDIVSKKDFVHQLLQKIVGELYEEYLQINSQKEQAKFSAMVNKTEKAETQSPNIKPVMIPENTPNTLPSTVLLGLTFTSSLCLPKLLPNR